MLTAYIDESGFGDKDIIVLGGFFGTDHQWAKCGQRWTAALGKRKSLHMKRLRWKNSARIKPLLEKLGPIPHECGLTPVWTRLRTSDYADLVEDTSVSRKLSHGYFIGAQFLGLVLIGFTRLLGERMKIVFEYNEQFAKITPYIIEMYDKVFDLKYGTVPCLAGVEVVPKESTCLTQPADYLTYARLQQLRDPHSLRSRLCAPILSPQPGVYVEVKRATIRRLMLSDSQKELRAIGRQLEPYIQKVRKMQEKNL